MKRMGWLGFVLLLTIMLVMVMWVSLPGSGSTAVNALTDNGATGGGSPDYFVYTPAADWTAFQAQSAQFGFTVSSAGDVNGDGFDDVIVGANWYDNGEQDEGAAFLYLGGPIGLSPVFHWHYESNQANEEFGTAVAGAGDVNGDGYDDVIIGANSPLPDMGGKAYLFLGSPGGLLDEPVWTAVGEQLEDGFGTAVAGAGDVNGDGYDDIIVGAPYALGDDGVERGRAYVYYGTPDGPAAMPDWIAESDLPNARFGISVSTAGDVNGDGFDDIIIGASHYPADGVVGMAAVFTGGRSGLPAPAQGLVPTPADALSVLYGYFEDGSQFGFAVSTAGDTNSDGYDDVIVGAPGSNEGWGAAFIYYGSAQNGLGSPTFLSEYGQMLGAYGYSVSTAGDVNGDGHADVIVGAKMFDASFSPGASRRPLDLGGGAAFVYPGYGFGVDTYPIWAGASLTPTAHYGAAVDTAGDVNGDGFADFVVGAPNHPNPTGFSGQVFGYYGSGWIETLTAVNSSPTRLGNQTFFQALALGAGHLQYEWAFGDGATAVGKSTRHVYAAPGLYTAVVTATSLTNYAVATTPVTITVDAPITPGAGGELEFTNPETGLGLRVNVPPGAVTDLFNLSYTPLDMIPQPSPTNTIGYYFDLDVVEPERVFLPVVVGGNGSGYGGTAVGPANLPFNAANSFPFLRPVSVTIFYNEDTLPPGASETDMKLLYWDIPSQTWLDAATTCTPTSTYTYNPAENWFRVDICHLTRFAVVGG
jgi:hypothetical protein